MMQEQELVTLNGSVHQGTAAVAAAVTTIAPGAADNNVTTPISSSANRTKNRTDKNSDGNVETNAMVLSLSSSSSSLLRRNHKKHDDEYAIHVDPMDEKAKHESAAAGVGGSGSGGHRDNNNNNNTAHKNKTKNRSGIIKINTPTAAAGASGPTTTSCHGLNHSCTDVSGDTSGSSVLVLLPIDVQMALLEDTVFGWTHLTSELVGHTLAPAFVYWLVFTTALHLLTMYAVAMTTIATNGDDYDGSGSDGSDSDNDTVLSPSSVNAVHVLAHMVALAAAAGTFWFIRRRRRVWFRSAYGSRAYRRDRHVRRREVRLADRNNVLGRMIGNIQDRRRTRDLERAKRRFARKHSSSLSFYGSTTTAAGNAAGNDDYLRSRRGIGNNNINMNNADIGGIKSPTQLFHDETANPDGMWVGRRSILPFQGNHYRGDDKSGNDDDDDRTQPLSVVSSSESASGSDDDEGGIRRRRHSRPPLHHEQPQHQQKQLQQLQLQLQPYNADGSRQRVDRSQSSFLTPSSPFSDGSGSGSVRYSNNNRRCYSAITQDHVPIPRIKHLAYVHGGYFGAAPFFLADPQWVRILRRLLPDVYVEISRRVLFSPSSKLIHWAENNPVVAAYGALQALDSSDYIDNGRPPPDGSNNNSNNNNNAGVQKKMMTFPDLEWDVFVDPRLVRRVQAVLDAMDEFTLKHGTDAVHGSSVYSPPSSLSDVNNNNNNNNPVRKHQPQQQQQDLPLPPLDGSDVSTIEGDGDDGNARRERILQYLEKELTQRAQELTDQLLIAHGNLMQLILEQMGIMKDLNYFRVQRTRRTLGGGIYARQWMAIFAEALRLGSRTTTSNDDEQNSIVQSGFFQQHDSFSDEYDDDDDSPALWACLDTSLAESMEVIRQITNVAQPLGIVLDLKSRHVPPRVWSLVVDTLQTAGIRVVGIASFEMSEIRGVRDYCKTTMIQPAAEQSPLRPSPQQGQATALSSYSPNPSPVKEILFVHSAGDIQVACEEGKVQPGDHVFFNGGSLIYESSRSSLWKSLALPTCGYDFTGGSFDPRTVLDGYQIHPCGLPSSRSASTGNGGSDLGGDNSTTRTPLTKALTTLQDYKRHYQFSMGIYVQEFAIDETAARLLVDLVNHNPDLYDLGFAWGGINGMTVRGIQPGRFTSTDGYWNQRRIGQRWKER